MNRNTILRPILAPALLAMSAAVAAPLMASELTISPVRIVIPVGQRSELLSLSNDGDKPIQIQIRSFEWSQVDGHDVLTPTRKLIPSPPTVTIPARGSQTVRVVLNTPTSTAGGTRANPSFRIKVSELNPAESNASGIKLRLEYSLPVFSEPAVGDKPILRGSVSREGNDVKLTISNSGNRAARFSEINVVNGGETTMLAEGAIGYALPDSYRTFVFKDAAKSVKPNSLWSAKVNEDTDAQSLEVRTGP